MPPHGKKFANHWHGSQPVRDRRNPVTKLGTPAARQHTASRHETLASIGPRTYAATFGDQIEYVNGDRYVNPAAYAWARRNRLIELTDPERPGGAQKVQRTELGDQVLAAWNAVRGEQEV